MLEDRVQYKFLKNDPRYKKTVEIEMKSFTEIETHDFVILYNEDIDYKEIIKDVKKETKTLFKFILEELTLLLNK